MNNWTQPAAGTAPEDAAQAWLLRLRSGEATRTDVASWRAWLDASASHRDAFERARTVWEGVSPLGPLMAQLYADHGTETKDHASSGWFTASPARRRFALGSVLAAAALAISWVVPPLEVWSADLKSGVGEVIRATLPDGTAAWLDTDSALRVHFTDRERRLELVRGQVWFDVHAEPRRPFVVQAGEGSATDVGTLFGVRREQNDVSVSVIRGAVRVAWHQRDLLLGAGEAAKFGDRPLVATGKVDPDQIAWQSGHLVFDGQPLREVLAEMDRYWPGRIVLRAPKAAGRPISAMLSLHDLSAGLDALARSERVRITRLTNYLVVVTDAPEG